MMYEKVNPTTTMDKQPKLPYNHDEDDDSPEAFADRVRALYGHSDMPIDRLTQLASNPDLKIELDEYLDELAIQALEGNEEFARNAKAMRSGELTKEQQEVVRDRQKQLLKEYKEAILKEAGIDTTEALDDLEFHKTKITEKVTEYVEAHDDVEALDVLTMLGVLKKDKDGNERFYYPRGLFAKSTDAKWKTYIETVRRHMALKQVFEGENNTTVSQPEMEEANRIRTTAHNAVTRDIHRQLGLENLSANHRWDFMDTRGMVAKMRDTKFPNAETSERLRTETAVTEAVIGAEAVRVLVSRISEK